MINFFLGLFNKNISVDTWLILCAVESLIELLVVVTGVLMSARVAG